MKVRTKSKRDLFEQIKRMEKAFYSLPNYEKQPYLGQMALARKILEQYLTNINNYWGDWNVDDEDMFNLIYDTQIPKSVYTKKITI